MFRRKGFLIIEWNEKELLLIRDFIFFKIRFIWVFRENVIIVEVFIFLFWKVIKIKLNKIIVK